MDFTNHRYAELQYSTVNNKLNYSTVATVAPEVVLSNIVDLIKNPDYKPYYSAQLKKLGAARFMELTNKARAGSETPHVLFKWFLNNPEQVK